MFEEFVRDLRRLSPLERADGDIARMLQAVASGTAFAADLPRRPGDYTRTCAYADDRFEVLLLDWSAGAVSAIHDHGGQHCWLVVTQGRLIVDDFERVDAGQVREEAVLAARGSRELEIGGLDARSGSYDVHRVSAREHAISLHVYARPIEEFLIYDKRARRCRPARSTYDRRWSTLPGVVAP